MNTRVGSSEGTPRLSVVVPVYEEEANVRPLFDRLERVLSSLDCSWEIVFVDDGSGDGTWERIVEVAGDDSRVRALSLSRNFGKHHALFAGLCHAAGEAVVSMDGDLQHPPELIPEMVERWRQGAKIVKTLRRDSEDTPVLKRLTSRWFERTFSLLSGLKVSHKASDFHLIDRKVLTSLTSLQDPELFLRGMIDWIGFDAETVPYEAEERHAGSTKFGWRNLFKLAGDALLSFSSVPLKLGIWIGGATAAFAVALSAYSVVQFFRNATVPGWATIVVGMSVMFAVVFLLLGILGAYIASIHAAVKNRPRFVVEESVNVDDPNLGIRAEVPPSG